MSTIEKLNQLALEFKKTKYPSVPEYALVKPKLKEDNTNDLTRSIMQHLKIHNCFVSRVNVQGQYREDLKRFVHSGSTLGMPDIVGIYRGQFIGIEIKYGRDQQSEVQKQRHAEIEAAGGLYVIVKSYEQFKMWFEINFK